MTTPKIGVLLTNIGTPAAPNPTAVRQYLKKFLSDRRVVELPRIAWWPILYGLILPFRSNSSAKLYKKIWTDNGSPLLVYSKKLADKLQQQLQLPVALGMHYSQPSIAQALSELQSKQVQKIVVIPLYPQYSATTTASAFDAVANTLKKWRVVPQINLIDQYSDHPYYIRALTQSIVNTWQTRGKAQHLLFSFHGIPKSYADAGDPYPVSCIRTAKAIAAALDLSENEYSVSFQSRLGKSQWLTPYTDKVLASLPKKGLTDIQVICPGFATDCLETLEEISIRGKEQFLEAGGQSFYYIPALNDQDDHVAMLARMIENSN